MSNEPASPAQPGRLPGAPAGLFARCRAGLVKLLLGVAAVFALLCVTNSRRVYLHSPVNNQVITLFRPISLFWESYWYVIPSAYTSWWPPHTAYARIDPRGLSYLVVNWAPKGPFRRKLGFESGATRNTLPLSHYYFAQENPDDVLDAGESWALPKYTACTIADILQGHCISPGQR